MTTEKTRARPRRHISIEVAVARRVPSRFRALDWQAPAEARRSFEPAVAR